MAQEYPCDECADFVEGVGSYTPDGEPFESDTQAMPEAGGCSEEFFFRWAMEVWKAIEDAFVVGTEALMLLCGFYTFWLCGLISDRPLCALRRP
jgi:hypothetical protein